MHEALCLSRGVDNCAAWRRDVEEEYDMKYDMEL